MSDYFDENGIRYFDTTFDLAKYLIKKDENHQYLSPKDWLNEFNLSGEEQHVVIIDDDVETIKLFDSYKDAKRYIMETFLVRNEYIYKGIFVRDWKCDY